MRVNHFFGAAPTVGIKAMLRLVIAPPFAGRLSGILLPC